MEDTVAVVLAAGKGTRMRSEHPKALHAVADRPMLAYVLDTVSQLGCSRTIVVVGHQGETVRTALGLYRATWVEQREQLGTGHAMLEVWPVVGAEPRTLLVVPGDAPLIRAATLRALIMAHEKSAAAATVLTAFPADPAGYGRIVRDADDVPLRIVEERDADRSAKHLREVNAGMYAFSSPVIFEALRRLEPSNVQNEYYLTDAIALLREMGLRTGTVTAEDAQEVRGINTVEELTAVEAILTERAGTLKEGEARSGISS